MYKVGDKVVYPHHGAGTVVKREARTVLGFVGGFIHLISMLNRHEADKPSKPNGGTP